MPPLCNTLLRAPIDIPSRLAWALSSSISSTDSGSLRLEDRTMAAQAGPQSAGAAWRTRGTRTFISYSCHSLGLGPGTAAVPPGGAAPQRSSCHNGVRTSGELDSGAAEQLGLGV